MCERDGGIMIGTERGRRAGADKDQRERADELGGQCPGRAVYYLIHGFDISWYATPGTRPALVGCLRLPMRFDEPELLIDAARNFGENVRRIGVAKGCHFVDRVTYRL